MGPSATGKSTLIATLAEYVWETFHKQTYYYLTDGGGFPTKLQSLVDLGIVRLWRLRTRSAQGLTFETLQRACQGWWPARIHALTGEVEPAVKLVPPMQTVCEIRCSKGHVMRTVYGAVPSLVSGFCPTCKAAIPVTQQTLHKTTTFTKGFEERGAVCFDGLTSMAPMMMQDLAARAGRMELQGEKAGLGGVVGSGDLIWAGNNRAQVGFAQSRLEELVAASLGIPGLVVPPVFTALTQEATDSGGLSVRGPELAGQAKTASAPQWFGNVLETTLTKNADGEDCHTLLIEGFIDPGGVKHPLRTRAKPGILPKMLVDPSVAELRKDPNLACSQFNLGVFFRLLDAALEAEKAAQRERFPDAPGTPEEMVFGGEEGSAAQPAQPSKSAPPAMGPVMGGGKGMIPLAAAHPPAPTPAPVEEKKEAPSTAAAPPPPTTPAPSSALGAAAAPKSPLATPAGARPGLAPPPAMGGPRVAKAPSIPRAGGG